MARFFKNTVKQLPCEPPTRSARDGAPQGLRAARLQPPEEVASRRRVVDVLFIASATVDIMMQAATAGTICHWNSCSTGHHGSCSGRGSCVPRALRDRTFGFSSTATDGQHLNVYVYGASFRKLSPRDMA